MLAWEPQNRHWSDLGSIIHLMICSNPTLLALLLQIHPMLHPGWNAHSCKNPPCNLCPGLGNCHAMQVVVFFFWEDDLQANYCMKCAEINVINHSFAPVMKGEGGTVMKAGILQRVTVWGNCLPNKPLWSWKMVKSNAIFLVVCVLL